MSPLSNHPVRPDRVWRSQAAMNGCGRATSPSSLEHDAPASREPRPTRADLETLLKAAPNREVWLEAKRQYLEGSDVL